MGFSRVHLTILLLAVLAGCSRSHYRMRADAQAHAIIQEKSAFTPWMPPSDFTIAPLSAVVDVKGARTGFDVSPSSYSSVPKVIASGSAPLLHHYSGPE